MVRLAGTSNNGSTNLQRTFRCRVASTSASQSPPGCEAAPGRGARSAVVSTRRPRIPARRDVGIVQRGQALELEGPPPAGNRGDAMLVGRRESEHAREPGGVARHEFDVVAEVASASRAIRSASTQWAEPAWDSKRVPGPSRVATARRAHARAGSVPSGSPQERRENRQVWNRTCSRVTTSLPWNTNSGCSR